MKKEQNKNIIGIKYNYLTIINDLGIINGRRTVIAKCDCGIEKKIKYVHIKNNNTKSCGCLLYKQKRLSSHPLYLVWISMLDRCYNSKKKCFKDYGGRGVTVCEQWKDNYQNFYHWAIERWEPGLQLDKDLLAFGRTGYLYSPEFCCFLTRKENCRNKSSNVLVEIDGMNKCVKEWAEYLEVPVNRIWNRIRRGRTHKDVIEEIYLNRI